MHAHAVDGRRDDHVFLGGTHREHADAGGADVWRTVEAATTSYGAGFPGTHGIPNLSAVNLPGVSETFTANVDNSLGASTIPQSEVGGSWVTLRIADAFESNGARSVSPLRAPETMIRPFKHPIPASTPA